MVGRAARAALALVVMLAPGAAARTRSNGIGVYFDPAGSVCNAEIDPSQVLDAYVMVTDLTADLGSIVFRVSYSPDLLVTERHVNAALFATSTPIVLPQADEWSLSAPDCVDRRSLLLVHYRFALTSGSSNLRVCVEPTTVDPRPPTYVTCEGLAQPMQPAYPGLGIQEGCATVNSAGDEGGAGPRALCSGVVSVGDRSWGGLKARFER